MKKAYIAYMVVMSILCIGGLLFLIKIVEKSKANMAALDASITQRETHLSAVEAQVAKLARPIADDFKDPEVVSPKKEAKAAERASETPVTGFAPSCAPSTALGQAVNRTPSAKPYLGQLRVSWQYPDDAQVYGARKVIPCVAPGTHPAPGGTVKVSDAEPMLDEPPNTRFEPGYVTVAWSSSDDRARERAKPRDRSGEYTKTERRRDAPPPKGRQSHETKTDAQRRHPQSTNDDRRNRDRNATTEAQRRHPRPDGRYDRDRSENRHDYDRYHWRKYSGRSRWDRDRFPRRYFGPHSFFHGLRYRAHTFGPHDRLWYHYRSAWRLFYWPYPYAPAYGCGWYFVPTARYPAYDPYTSYPDEEYWDYTDYQYIYLCFDS